MKIEDWTSVPLHISSYFQANSVIVSAFKVEGLAKLPLKSLKTIEIALWDLQFGVFF